MKRLLALFAGLVAAHAAFAEVTVSSLHPSWTALNKSGIGTAYVDIKLQPGTQPANATFAVEAISDSPRFTVSTARLTLGRTGTARLAIRSTGATNVLVRLREVTSGGQTLEASVNFYGALTLAVSTNSITLDDILRIHVYGAVPPCTITASPSNLLDIRPDGTAVARGTRSGVVMLGRESFGRRIEAGTPLARMQDPVALEVRAQAMVGQVSGLGAGAMGRADPVGAATGSGAESLRGPIAVAPAVDPASRMVQVVMRPERIEPWALSGMPIRLSILGGSEAPQLAVPARALIRDGATIVLFRRDPKDPNRVIRLEADVGATDGAWTVIRSGVREGDEVVIDGAYQLMLASSGSAPKGGHFHADGTFHEGED